MTMNVTTTAFVDKVAPKHCRTSCSDESPTNERYAPDDMGGCYRCTLLAAYRQGVADSLAIIEAKSKRAITPHRGVLKRLHDHIKTELKTYKPKAEESDESTD